MYSSSEVYTWYSSIQLEYSKYSTAVYQVHVAQNKQKHQRPQWCHPQQQGGTISSARYVAKTKNQRCLPPSPLRTPHGCLLLYDTVLGRNR